jgi:hypothetical protein
MAGCGALSAVSGIPGSNHGRQRRKRSEVSAAGSAAVRPSREVAAVGGHRPLARPPSWNRPRRCPPTGPLARLPDTTADVRPPQRTHCRWPLCGTCVGHPTRRGPYPRAPRRLRPTAPLGVRAVLGPLPRAAWNHSINTGSGATLTLATAAFTSAGRCHDGAVASLLVVPAVTVGDRPVGSQRSGRAGCDRYLEAAWAR